MSKSLRQTSLMILSGTLMVLTLSACTVTDRDPAEARSATLSAEEQAAKTTIKMVPALVVFVLPSMFFVTLGPAVIQLIHTLLPGK